MRLVRVLAATAVVTAALAGCSGREQANETLPSASPSAAETSESLPPLGPPDFPMPPEAREQTEAGASAFTEYYLALINHTNVAMESEHLRQLSRGCATCERLATEVDTDAASGYRYDGGQLTVAGPLQSTLTSAEKAESAFILDQGALQVLDASGQPVEGLSFPALNDVASGAATVWSNDLKSWIVTDLTLG